MDKPLQSTSRQEQPSLPNVLPCMGVTYCAPSGLFRSRPRFPGRCPGLIHYALSGLDADFQLAETRTSSALQRAQCLPLRTICHPGSMGICGALAYHSLRRGRQSHAHGVTWAELANGTTGRSLRCHAKKAAPSIIAMLKTVVRIG